MSNSNQRYSVWDSYNDMALSLSPTLGNPETCTVKGCNGLIPASAWNRGHRCCLTCIERISGASKNYKLTTKEQTSLNLSLPANKIAADTITTDKIAADKIADNRFKRALQDAENKANREEWLAAIPTSWKI